jgi:hypothetical protein
MIKRYLLYLLRWQLSTPILAPVIAFFKHSPSLFGTREDWIGSAIANLIGGLIFFWVDRFIFTSEKLGAVWQVHENVTCVECGKTARGYRLVKTEGYDKTKSAPQFRCEECSQRKSETLRKRGLRID